MNKLLMVIFIELYELYEEGKISITQKYIIEKFRFKNEYMVKEEDELSNDYSYYWMNRDYLYKIDELYKSKDSPFNKFLENFFENLNLSSPGSGI